MRKNRQNNKTYRNIEIYKTTESNKKEKTSKHIQTNGTCQKEHVKRQGTTRTQMYNDVGKNKNDQTQRKGSNVHKEQKQQVAKQTHINNRTETTNGFQERKQRFKHKHCKQHTQKTEKTKKTRTNTHTGQKETTP